MDVYVMNEDCLSLTNTLNVLCSREIAYSSLLDHCQSRKAQTERKLTLPSRKLRFLRKSN